MNCKLWLQVLMVLVVWLELTLSGSAVCVYNRAANAIWIYDYSSEVPARPRHLLFADQMNEWGMVVYDSAKDTYTINANLWIGRNNGSDTYVQLGTPKHTNETLILKGNLVIYPTFIKGENKPGAQPAVHRLTIGCPEHPDVCARLLFDNASDQQYTLRAGSYFMGSPSPLVRRSGQLHVHHSMISAVNLQYKSGPNFLMYLSDTVLQHAVISGVRGTILYGAHATPYDQCLIEDSVFEYAGNAIAWGTYDLHGVAFRNLDAAIKSWSPSTKLMVTLTECRFEDNDANWILAGTSKIYLIDCVINPPRQGNCYAARADAQSDSLIRVVSRRHVRVKAVDADGQPVPDVRIEVADVRDGRVQQTAVTDTAGLTPLPGMPDALLLDEWEEQSGLKENEPERGEFIYTITAIPTKGRPAVVCADFRPTRSSQILEVVLSE